MKKIYFAIGLAFVALVGYSIFVTKAYKEEQQKAKTLNQTINDLNQEIDAFEIRLNDSTVAHAARVNDLNMTIDNIKHRYDGLLKGSNVKPKDVDGIVETGVVTHSVEYVPVKVDTFGGLSASYRDDYTAIDVNIDSLRLATIDYSIKDSITIINYQKKHRLLFGLIKWNENTKTIVVSKNPKTTIVGVTSINNIEK